MTNRVTHRLLRLLVLLVLSGGGTTEGDQLNTLAATPTNLVWNTPLRVQTIAGKSGVSGSTNGAALDARFSGPFGIAVDQGGVIFISDRNNHTIRRLSPEGLATTLAGGPGQVGALDGPGAEARFNYPSGLAVDKAGNLFVADSVNQSIRKITREGIVSTLAGPNAGVSPFSNPSGVAVDGSGNVLVADASGAVLKVSPAGAVTLVAGKLGEPGFTNAAGSLARFRNPSGIALTTNGTIYVADTGNSLIRVISPEGSVTTLSGLVEDASGKPANLFSPVGLALDSIGYIYVSEQTGYDIRKISPDGVVVTLAGGASGDDGIGYGAGFGLLGGLTLLSDGTLLIADNGRNTIKKGEAYYGPPSINRDPSAPALSIGSNAIIRVQASGTPPLIYEWIYNGTVVQGATGPELTLTNFQASMTGNYSVNIRNGFGSLSSTNVSVQVAAPSIFTLMPNPIVAVGLDVGFGVSATGTGPLLYQWFFNSTPLQNQTNRTISLRRLETNQAGLYRVSVKNDFGSVTSSNAALTILTLQPETGVARAGGDISFTFSAIGDPVVPRWTRSGTALPGQNSEILTLTNVQPQDSGTIIVTVTNSHGVSGQISTRLQVEANSWKALPIPVSGWNADVVVENAALPKASDFDSVGAFWYENGIAHQGRGFPTGRKFTSSYDPTVLFELQSYTSSNAVRMTTSAGKLTLSRPARYHSLSLLCGSGAGDGRGTLTLNFTDGTSKTNLPFLSPDWWDGYQCGVERHPALRGLSRLYAPLTSPDFDEGVSFRDFSLTETDIDLARLGVENRLLQSITFNRNPNAAVTSILAISGVENVDQNLPVILIQPTNVTAQARSAVTLSVQAASAGSVTFQWKYRGHDLPNATGSSLILPDLQPAQVGAYSVEVGNENGSVLSEVAIVRLPGTPLITRQPVSLRRSLGAPATFSLQATGSAPRYQWTLNERPIPNATNATLGIPKPTLQDAGIYVCEVSNTSGTVLSVPAALGVLEITASSVKIAPTGSVTLTANLAGEDPAGYQWYRLSTPLAGETNRQLTLRNFQPKQAGAYSVRVFPSDECARSATITLQSFLPNLRFGATNGEPPVVLRDGVLEFTLTTEPGFTVRLEDSVDLATWRLLKELASPSQILKTTVTSPTDQKHFFRATLPPQ